MGWKSITGIAVTTLALLVAMGDDDKVERFPQQNLYVKGSAANAVARELEVIAIGMTFFFVNAERKAPAYERYLKNPLATELLELVATKPSFDKQSDWIAHVVLDERTFQKSICTIYLRPELLTADARSRDMDANAALLTTLIHEAVHCGHAQAFSKKDRFYEDIASEYLKQNPEFPAGKRAMGLLISAARLAHMETFPGAFAKANLESTYRSSGLVEHVAETAWSKERKGAYGTMFPSIFEAVATICTKPGDCPVEIPRLNRDLIENPAYRAALVKDLPRAFSLVLSRGKP